MDLCAALWLQAGRLRLRPCPRGRGGLEGRSSISARSTDSRRDRAERRRTGDPSGARGVSTPPASSSAFGAFDLRLEEADVEAARPDRDDDATAEVGEPPPRRRSPGEDRLEPTGRSRSRAPTMPTGRRLTPRIRRIARSQTSEGRRPRDAVRRRLPSAPRGDGPSATAPHSLSFSSRSAASVGSPAGSTPSTGWSSATAGRRTRTEDRATRSLSRRSSIPPGSLSGGRPK